jgi:hypothetical protein
LVEGGDASCGAARSIWSDDGVLLGHAIG